ARGEDCVPVPRQPGAPNPSNQPKKESHGESGTGAGSARDAAGPQATPQVVQIATPVTAGVDTGTIPQGGIQAGAGGTADEGSTAGLPWGGALILVVAAGGLALRRRHRLTS